MNRSRSVSRRPSLGRRGDSLSPSHSHSYSSSSDSRKSNRSRSQSRAPPAHHRVDHNSSSSLSKSTGVLAGIGIVALVTLKLWGKSSSDNTQERDGGRRNHVRRHGQGPRSRAAERHQLSHGDGYGQGQRRWALGGEEPGGSLREPRRRSVEHRSWGPEESHSQMQSSAGFVHRRK